MRSINTLTAAVLYMFGAGSAAAQDLGNKVSMDFSLTPTPRITVTNNYSSRLTGVVITVSNTVAPYKTNGIIWFDSAVNFHNDPPLETGQSRSWPVIIQKAPNLRPQLMAVTFEDSTSAGDPQWLSKLHGRRKAVYDEIGAVSELLNEALAQGQSNDQIISALNSMKQSLKTSIPEQEARMAAGTVIYTAVSNLERGGLVGAKGDPQKTIPLSIDPIFAEWRGALRRYEKGVT